MAFKDTNLSCDTQKSALAVGRSGDLRATSSLPDVPASDSDLPTDIGAGLNHRQRERGQQPETPLRMNGQPQPRKRPRVGCPRR